MLDLRKLSEEHNKERVKGLCSFMDKEAVEELGARYYNDPKYYDLGIIMINGTITIYDVEDIFRSYDQAIVIVDNKIRTGESAPNRYIEAYIQNGKIIPDLIRAAC